MLGAQWLANSDLTTTDEVWSGRRNKNNLIPERAIEQHPPEASFRYTRLEKQRENHRTEEKNGNTEVVEDASRRQSSLPFPTFVIWRP